MEIEKLVGLPARIERIEQKQDKILELLLQKKEPDEVLKIDEASKLIKKSISTIYKLVSSRAIPFTKPGGHVRFSRKKLLSWLEEFEKLPKTKN